MHHGVRGRKAAERKRKDTVPGRQGQRPEYQEAGAGCGLLRGALLAQGTSVLQQPRLCLSLSVLTRPNGLLARGAQEKEWKKVRKQEKKKKKGRRCFINRCILASFYYCLIIYAACHSFIHSIPSRNLEAVISPTISVH